MPWHEEGLLVVDMSFYRDATVDRISPEPNLLGALLGKKLNGKHKTDGSFHTISSYI